mmetsp:Transcript_82486/g.267193  ORF Transcript_82486/g.267193 Transcript_82486/m.267193 type:complete len:470 (-) Transcript_82486:61-1470(-)
MLKSGLRALASLLALDDDVLNALDGALANDIFELVRTRRLHVRLLFREHATEGQLQVIATLVAGNLRLRGQADHTVGAEIDLAEDNLNLLREGIVVRKHADKLLGMVLHFDEDRADLLSGGFRIRKHALVLMNVLLHLGEDRGNLLVAGLAVRDQARRLVGSILQLVGDHLGVFFELARETLGAIVEPGDYLLDDGMLKLSRELSPELIQCRALALRLLVLQVHGSLVGVHLLLQHVAALVNPLLEFRTMAVDLVLQLLEAQVELGLQLRLELCHQLRQAALHASHLPTLLGGLDHALDCAHEPLLHFRDLGRELRGALLNAGTTSVRPVLFQGRLEGTSHLYANVLLRPIAHHAHESNTITTTTTTTATIWHDAEGRSHSHAWHGWSHHAWHLSVHVLHHVVHLALLHRHLCFVLHLQFPDPNAALKGGDKVVRELHRPAHALVQLLTVCDRTDTGLVKQIDESVGVV